MGLAVRLGLLAIGLAWISTPASASDDTRLHERLARYALDTDQADLALHWLWEDDSPDAAVLRGEAYAKMGLAARAEHSLELVIASGEPLSPNALLVLAKAQKSLGDSRAAQNTLIQITHASSGLAGQEAGYLLAASAISDEAYDHAGKILSRLQDGYWAAMGYLNLATAYARQDSDTARSLIALRVARAMLGDSTDAAHPELLQRIQLTAGYLALKSDDPDKALSFLNKVALNGYYTPQALYFHGLALARKENYRGAMQSWHRARKFPLGFPGAADAWLGMGRGLDESGYLGQSGEAYLGAIAAFESELVTLRTLKQQVREQGGYDAMVLSAGTDNVEWFLADSKTLTQPRLAYLMHFMEEVDAQQAVRDVSELEQLGRRLKKKRDDLDVFETMLTQRLQHLKSRQGASRLAQAGQTIEALKARQKVLRKRLSAAAEGSDAADIASGETADRLDQIKTLRAQKKLTPDERERLKRLEGVLKWKAQEQFDLSRREYERQLDSIDRSLAAAESGYKRFGEQVTETPARFSALMTRVREARKETLAMLNRVDGIEQAARDHLDKVLLDFLNEQTAVMSAHLDRSQQQVAHLYEYLAVNRANDRAGEVSE